MAKELETRNKFHVEGSVLVANTAVNIAGSLRAGWTHKSFNTITSSVHALSITTALTTIGVPRTQLTRASYARPSWAAEAFGTLLFCHGTITMITTHRVARVSRTFLRARFAYKARWTLACSCLSIAVRVVLTLWLAEKLLLCVLALGTSKG